MDQTPTKNMTTVKKHNQYRKKFILHEPSDPNKDEISFDLKSVRSDEDS